MSERQSGELRRVAVLRLPFAAPNLNDLIRAKGAAARGRRRRGGKRYDGYNAAKRVWANRVALCAAEQGIPSFADGAHVAFVIVERSKRRDPDNICAGAAKFINDGLVECGVLPSDDWLGVRSLRFAWEVGVPGVVVTLSEDPGGR